MFIEVLSPLQQESEYGHNKLSHLHTKYMFRLAKLGLLPSIFLYLNNDVHIFASWMFGKESIRNV